MAARYKRKGRAQSVRPRGISIGSNRELRFVGLAVFGFALLRLVVGMRRALVPGVAARRARMLLRRGMVHVRVATRLALRHGPRFSCLSRVVRGRRVRPRPSFPLPGILLSTVRAAVPVATT